MNTQRIQACRIIGYDHGVVVGVVLLILLENVTPPGIHILLYTHNVSLFFTQVIKDRAKAVFILIVTTIGTDIVRDDFQGILR